jgi:nucleoid-associated protein YgaU
VGKHHRVVGRHRAPSTAGRTAARIAISAGVATAPLVLTGQAFASPPGVPEAIRACESGDRNVEHGGDPGGVSTASGYYQFVNGTWRTFGGTEFAARAIAASKEEQTVVFERAYAANKLVDWEASRACWQPKVGRHASGGEAPRHAARSTPRHAAVETVRRPDGGGRYAVRAGDTLSGIAAAHHTTWRKVFDDNRDVVHHPDRIFPGERLRV